MRASEALRCDVDALLAPYALDAVDGDEADAVERHLGECVRCRAQVSEHRETASLLSEDVMPSPVGVWERISAEVARSLPRPELTLRGRGRRARRL